MKKVTKIAATLAAAAILALLPNTNAFTARAAEPVTYAVKFDGEEWRMQANTNRFDDDANSREMYYLYQDIKSGDIVVVYNDIATNVALDLGSTHLSNLTVAQNTKMSVIYSGGVDECFVLGGSTSAINGNIRNAYVYDDTTCTFNDNVETLTMYSNTSDRPTSSVSVVGTVEHLYVRPMDSNVHRTFYDLYRFNKNTLYVKEGKLQTDSWNYLTPDEYAVQLTGEGQAAPAPVSSDDEYDDVPQTGQNIIYIWLLFAAVLCFAGSYALRQTDK